VRPLHLHLGAPVRTVTRQLFQRCSELLPELMADRGCRRVLRALLKSPRRCRRDPEAALAPVALLARWAGSPGDLKAGTRLRRLFVRASAPSVRERLCIALRPEWPADWLEALARDRTTPIEAAPRVVFMTGEAWSRRKEAASLKETRASVAAEQAGKASPSTAEVRYANSLPPNSFRALGRRAEELLPRAAEFAKTPAQLRQLELTLAAIAEQPVPIARPCAHSARLRTVGPSYSSLPSRARIVICSGLIVEFDLTCCQLAVIARQWNIPELLAFLEARRDFWGVLLVEMGLPPEAKPALKVAIYCLIFGSSIPGIGRRLVFGEKAGKGKEPAEPTEGLAVVLGVEAAKEKAEEFMRNRWVRMLLKARKRRMAEVRAAGGAEHPDMPGHFIRIVPSKGYICRETGNFVVTRRGRSARQILAELAQSVERQIIRAAYELAEKNPEEFRIVVDLHDGFAVRFSRDAARWEKRIIEAVNERATELGIPTRLGKKVQPTAPAAEVPASLEQPPAPRLLTAEQQRAAVSAFAAAFRSGAAAPQVAAAVAAAVERPQGRAHVLALRAAAQEVVSQLSLARHRGRHNLEPGQLQPRASEVQHERQQRAGRGVGTHLDLELNRLGGECAAREGPPAHDLEGAA
jgi:hypothetical protein